MPELNEIKHGSELGYKSGNARQWLACPDCGKERWVSLLAGKPLYCYCRTCSNERKRGAKHHNWKGGRRVTCSYTEVLLLINDPFYPMTRRSYVYEHRLIIAKHINRCLKSNEIVHHLNGMKQDNRLENLVLISPAKHNKRTFIMLLQKRIRELEQLHMSI